MLSLNVIARSSRQRVAIAAAVGMFGMASTSFGYLLENFEGGTGGFVAVSGTATQKATGTFPADDAGAATTPTHYLDNTVAQGNFWGPKSRNLTTNPADRTAMAAAHFLELDATMTANLLSGGNGSFAGFAQMNEVAITMFSPASTSNINFFIQKNWAAAGVFDSSGQSATWSGTNGTRHLIWNLDAFTATDPTDSVVKTVPQLVAAHPELTDMTIWITNQVGNDPNAGDADFLLDTYKLSPTVPEPTTLGLVGGLIAPALMARRRRNA